MARTDQRSFYSGEAAAYETTRYGSRYGRMFRMLHRSAVQQVVGNAHRVLDVATGTGQMLPVLASVAGFLIASDLTPAMLHEAKRVAPTGGGIQFCVADAMRLPYEDATFDVVASSRFLHLFEPRIQSELINEMTRVLRSGGTLVTDFYSADARRIFKIPIRFYRSLMRKRAENDFRVSIRDARAMIEASGLKIAHVHGLGNFLLVPLLWLPLSWLIRIAGWLGHSWPQMSEQFLVVARKP